MKGFEKYSRGYFLPPVECYDWVKKEYIKQAPIWCSVDLRDGNQALVKPMSLDQKIDFFKLLVKIGFKEIEVGFPASSETEYEFLRALIDQDLIPDDVTIQVLTQARAHIIRKTFQALSGCKKAIVHLYNSTSKAQREQVFKKTKEEILNIAVEGAKMLVDLANETEGNFFFEYSPESFTGTEPEYAAVGYQKAGYQRSDYQTPYLSAKGFQEVGRHLRTYHPTLQLWMGGWAESGHAVLGDLE